MHLNPLKNSDIEEIASQLRKLSSDKKSWPKSSQIDNSFERISFKYKPRPIYNIKEKGGKHAIANLVAWSIAVTMDFSCRNKKPARTPTGEEDTI
jgi:hypothetical protein